MLRGGDSGPAIVPGQAKDSLLYKLVAREQEPAMPYKADKLSEQLIARFADWINAGAPFDKPSLKAGDPSITLAPSSAGVLAQPVDPGERRSRHQAIR